MRQKLTIILALGFSLFIGCNQPNQVDSSKADSNFVFGLLAGQNSEAGKDFVLNGVWNSFTGNGTTLGNLTTFSAKAGQKGIQLDDSTGFSSCYIIIEFNNTEGSLITQNPENNGACFAGDTNKGKYNKVFFFRNTAKENSYWSCTVAFGKTLEEAKAQTDTSNRTNPGTAGCGGFSFTRLERK
ncbi:MAG: hypothetical protein MUF77_04485 [Leptospira sp.]|jgi:hypothetical protein|nr:hypothetical protein [Leptospira sp.]